MRRRPPEATFLIEDIASRGRAAGKYEIHYAAPQPALFSVLIVAEKVRTLFEQRGVSTRMQHRLLSVGPGQKRSTFANVEKDAAGVEVKSTVELTCYYLHVIPPERAPEVIRQSGLSWPDKWPDQVWVEVDQKTLRRLRHPEIFALGDLPGGSC